MRIILATRGRRGVQSPHLETQVQAYTACSNLGFISNTWKIYVKKLKKKKKQSAYSLIPAWESVVCSEHWECRFFLNQEPWLILRKWGGVSGPPVCLPLNRELTCKGQQCSTRNTSHTITEHHRDAGNRGRSSLVSPFPLSL